MPSFLRAVLVIGARAHLAIGMAGFAVAASSPAQAAIEAPTTVPCFDPAEFTVRVEQPPFKNPFTEAEVTAVFTASNTPPITVPGFADSEDGSTFRLRFAPSQPGAIYPHELRLRGGGLDERFRGTLRCTPSPRPGPVIASPQHPRHFIYAGSGRPFYHLGYTAYHLLDPSNDDAQIAATIDYGAKHGFNKIRFLLAGYPRDFDRRTSGDVEYGVVAQAMKAPNSTCVAWQARLKSLGTTCARAGARTVAELPVALGARSARRRFPAMRRCAPRAKRVRRPATVHGFQGRNVNRMAQVTRKSNSYMKDWSRPTAGQLAQMILTMIRP